LSTSVLLQAPDRTQDFVFFLGRNVQFVERRDQQPDRRVPVLVGDAQTGMGGLHVASGIDARPAGRRAQLIDDQLANALDRVGAVADEELAELLIGGEPAKEIVGDCGECVVAAEPLVQCRLLGLDWHAIASASKPAAKLS
jgi:hypothetical protein